MSFALLIADPDALAYRDALARRFPDVSFPVATDPRMLGRSIEQADGLLTFGTWLDVPMIGTAPRLRWIQTLSTGTDRFVPLLAARPDIILTSARGAHGAPVSELALLLMLALARRLPRLLDNQRQQVWSPCTGTLLHDKTVGIAGFGTIGEQIAVRARAFGMSTIGFGSAPRRTAALDSYHLYSDLPALAHTLDVLVVVVPLSPASCGMIDRRVFSAMKPTATLVNVGRGAVVNEADLLEALRTGQIAGAAIDAFSTEPLSPASPFWSMPDVIVTPHLAGVHDRYPDYVLGIVETNLRLMLEGRVAEMMNRIACFRARK